MKNNSGNKYNILILMFLAYYFSYKHLPITIQVFIPLATTVSLLAKILYQIYLKSNLDEIMVAIVALIASLIGFFTLYENAYRHDKYSDSIELIAIGWVLVLFMFVVRGGLKRKGEMDKYKKSFFGLLCIIAQAIFCTVLAIIKW